MVIQGGMHLTECNTISDYIFVIHADADINSRDYSGKKPRQVAREGLTIEAQGKTNKRRDSSLRWSMCIKILTMQNRKIQT